MKLNLVALLLLSAAGASRAQDSAAPPTPDAANADGAPAVVPTIPVPEAATREPVVAEAQPENTTRLDDVVVTANKRRESSRTVAGAVTAIDSNRLKETGASTMADYLSLSPGVNFDSGTPGYSVITIRGVSTDTIPGIAQTAVGTYYDDIPLTDPGAPMVVPDIDAFDAQRIELLRGPQGALYGSASLGGALNYIPAPPNLAAPEYALQANGSLTHNSSLASTGKLMFNLPLFANTTLGQYGLGVRGVGYYTHTPGYIDNIGLDREQSNSSHTGGGRVVAGWAPTGNSVLRLTALYQRTEVDDAGYIDPSLGDLKKSTIEIEPSGNQLRLATLRYELEQDYGSWAFIGGYQDKRMHLEYDGASALGVAAAKQQFPLRQFGGVTGYSGELRFVSAPAERYNWLGGLSYATRTEDLWVTLDAPALQKLTGVLGALGSELNLGVLSTLAQDATLDQQHAIIKAPEAALFLDGTYYLTPTLKLAAGGRYYRNQVNSTVDSTGLLIAPTGTVQSTTQGTVKAGGFNPKISLAWQAADRMLLYGLYSRGYRLGGINLVPASTVTGAKPKYGPDEVKNYETGIKTSWLDGSLTADLSLFWIDWAAIPLVVVDRVGLFKYLDNAGNARSKGAELSLALRPWSFLTLRSALTYTDSRLLNDYDPKNNRPPAKAGDRLPGAPMFTTSNTATGMWYLGSYTATASLIHRYEGESSTNLSFQDYKKGGDHLFDLRAGLSRGGLSCTLYGKNLTDARAVNASNNYAKPGGDVLSLKFITPPRTVGVELGYTFSQE
ncbi:MAG TPA: TonB-dependent receptor [Nevskiaceae bacterium]|nr:TonB-dependent receptor [Nevskiaceae bacterium]